MSGNFQHPPGSGRLRSFIASQCLDGPVKSLRQERKSPHSSGHLGGAARPCLRPVVSCLSSPPGTAARSAGHLFRVELDRTSELQQRRGCGPTRACGDLGGRRRCCLGRANTESCELPIVRCLPASVGYSPGHHGIPLTGSCRGRRLNSTALAVPLDTGWLQWSDGSLDEADLASMSRQFRDTHRLIY